MKLNLLALFLFLGIYTSAQIQHPLYKDENQKNWVDSIYNSLSLEEKVGQLFMVAAYSNKGSAHENEIRRIIAQHHIGGLIFMQDIPLKQINLTNDYQSKSKIPLLIAMDGEWGFSMRLKELYKYPWSMTLGALADKDLVYQMGKQIAQDAHRLGVHMNFAPVVDVNTNPLNPIIGNRSFGSDVENVSQKGIAYMQGLQDHFVMASAKHFPGHGDTDKDSHKTLPSVLHKKTRLDSIELYPFRKLIQANVACIMAAHLNIPELESNSKYPSSLSKKIITDLLKNELGYQGLIITDALNMAGAANAFSAGELDLKAFEAGNDMLLFSQNVAKAKQLILNAINSGKISEERLAESVKKILMAKYFVGLNDYKPLSTENLIEDINTPQDKALIAKLFEKAQTVLVNQNNVLPIKNLQQKIAFVPLGGSNSDTFYQYLSHYTKVDQVKLTSAAQASKLKGYDLVIIGLHHDNSSPFKSYKVSSSDKQIIATIQQQQPAILQLFTSAYALKDLKTEQLKGLLVGYQNSKESQRAAAQVIFGAINVTGTLPVSVASFKSGDGIALKSLDRLGYDEPENVGLDSRKLQEIENIALDAINSKATPGMQILVAKKGKVIYEKTFGNHTYEEEKPVEWNDLFDIASVTKITATLPFIMRDVSQKKISPEDQLSKLLPYTANTNKANINLRDLLAHQAGLPAWIGFHKNTFDTKNAQLYLDYYSRSKNDEFNHRITDKIYLLNSYKDSIRHQILETRLGTKKYQYSDLAYFFMKDYVESSYGSRLDTLTQQYFYRPLGMNYTTYNPVDKFDLKQIIPTEKDTYFRNTLVHGYVHDQNAALLDGVGGHAGLFSNANDLAKMMQMYLNRGTYGGETFFDKETVIEFTAFQFKDRGNRRGLGFDKELANRGPTCGCTSEESFGHSGFTGTLVWADPKYDLVYIFLSNRVYPDAENRKLIKMNTREKIQRTIYSAIVEEGVN